VIDFVLCRLEGSESDAIFFEVCQSRSEELQLNECEVSIRNIINVACHRRVLTICTKYFLLRCGGFFFL